MKTIGLLGGMSWESTVSYYRIINEAVKHRLGGLHSARICLYSVEFGEIEALMRADRWGETAAVVADAARRVEAGGADFLLIATNTIHKVFPQVAGAVGIPVLHIADALGARLVAGGIRRAGLLGTRPTMQEDFIKGRLAGSHGIEVLVPPLDHQEGVHRVIFDELCRGTIREASRRQYLEVIEDLARRGAEAVVLGCTEIALLVGQADTPVPLFDTTAIHAEKAVDIALADDPAGVLVASVA
jgi:aspartate racemase